MTPGAASVETFETLNVAAMLGDIAERLAIVVVDGAGCIHHWSRGCEELYGWSSAEAVGAVKYDLLRSMRLDDALPWCDAVGSPAQILRETRRDGHRLQVLEQAVALATPGYRALCVVRDPTRDDSRTDDDRRVAMAIEISAIGIFGYDMATQRIEWSQNSWRHLGIDRGSLSLAQLAQTMQGAALATALTTCRKALLDGSSEIGFDLPVRGAILGYRMLRIRAQLVRNAGGTVDRFVGVFQDLHDADIRERALRDHQAEIGMIVETISDAMVIVDGGGTISAFSRAAQHLFGYPAPSMIGRRIDPFVEGGWFEILAATINGGRREMRMIHANGDRLMVELRMGILPSDRAPSHILLFTDISERKAKEARRTVFEQTARDIAMAEFAAHMMHELNQPLAAASNFLAVAQHFATDPDRTADIGSALDMALSQIQRVGGIVRRTHRKAAGEDMDPRSVSVRAAIDEVIALVQNAGNEARVSIDVDIHADAGTMVVDPVAIQQVLANLLRNAIEALGSVAVGTARIEIASQRIGQSIVLSIQDNGPGIAPRLMPDLFEPFGQRDKKGGMGLGLSICRTIVEAHGGSLNAENVPGGGAKFTMSLPSEERDETL